MLSVESCVDGDKVMIDSDEKPIQINLSRKAFGFLQGCMKAYMTENNHGGGVAQEVIEELELN